MMFPVAGVVVWIALGLLAGYIAGQISGAEGANRSMANMGVGLCAAVVGGAVITFAQTGSPTNTGFGLSIVAAVVAACVALAVFRALHRGPSTTLR